MAILAATYLLDTNILLRLSEKRSREFQLVRPVLNALVQKQARLCYTSQNLIEFWNVSTRPVERNGHGLSAMEADAEARGFEEAFLLLPDTEAIHLEWRRLVVAYGIAGVQVHDARIVACMKTHGIRHLLTLNGRDFMRYKEITALHPSQVGVQK
ncbi:MAG TPA: PIN domain-containing protein [Candidatus Angelobacter sp.]